MKSKLKLKPKWVVALFLGVAACIALVISLAVTLTGRSNYGPVTLTVVQNEGGNKSSPFLYGIMFEVRTSHCLFTLTKVLTKFGLRKWTTLVR